MEPREAISLTLELGTAGCLTGGLVRVQTTTRMFLLFNRGLNGKAVVFRGR